VQEIISHISGHWLGYFEYGAEYGNLYGEKVTFSLLLEHTGEGQFQGKGIEHEGVGMNPEPSTIKGYVDGQNINFIKEYQTYYEFDEAGNEVKYTRKPAPLLTYFGEFNSSDISFEGHWELETPTNPVSDHVYIWTGTWKITKVK